MEWIDGGDAGATLKSLIADEIRGGSRIAVPLAAAAGSRITSWVPSRGNGAWVVRMALAACLTLALILIGLSVGRASDRDETVLTAKVSSADHETEEGYFALGENATVIAKPGSDLYRFLARQRGHKVRIVLQDAAGPELSRLERLP